MATAQQKHEELRLLEKIYYERGTYIATEQERAALKELVFSMRADSTLKVHIVGYSDKWGGEAINNRFSYVRAMYIADWMRSCRVPREQIVFVGEGIDTLAVNDAEARRVEVLQVVETETLLSNTEKELSKTEEITQPDPVIPSITQPTPEPDPEPTPEPEPQPKRSIPITLRTNLLYFAVGMFNVGAEYRVGEFGYLLNIGYSPFGGDGWEHSLGGWFISPEVRYYIPTNDRWFAGVQLLAGGYNVKLSETGYQGSVIGTTLLGGYRLTLTERFDMDFNIGLGYGSYRYDSYSHRDGENIYKESDRKKGGLLPQAGVNIIWKIK